jgi:hypothetical protein
LSYLTQRPADKGKVLTLALQETLFVVAWAALAGALFLPLTRLWILSMLPAALIAINFLAAMEMSGEGSPLVSTELEQHPANGARVVSKMSVYFRILLTVLLFPPLLIGYVTLLFGAVSIPELITDIRLTAVNRGLDPRPRSVIRDIVRKTGLRLWVLIIVPMIVAAAAFLLLHTAPSAMSLQSNDIQNELSSEEQELLTHYLELTALHPEELEYHVRLASLYYRNNMQQDLTNELTVIGGIDSTHAILLLADTTAFTFSQLEPLPEDSSTGLYADAPVGLVAAAEPDSTEADSTQADSTSTDSLVIQPDTTGLVTVEDSLPAVSVDTVQQVPDIQAETLPDSLLVTPVPEEADTSAVTPEPEEPDTSAVTPEPEEPDTSAVTPEPEPEVTQETEEETVEPDTLVQP